MEVPAGGGGFRHESAGGTASRARVGGNLGEVGGTPTRPSAAWCHRAPATSGPKKRKRKKKKKRNENVK